MAVRGFDGVDDKITCQGTAEQLFNGAFSVVIIADPLTQTDLASYLSLRTSANVNVGGAEDFQPGASSGRIYWYSPGGATNPSFTTFPASTKQIMGWTKAAGSVQGRSHQKTLGSGSWSQNSGGDTFGADATSIDRVIFGANNTSGFQNMNLAVVALFLLGLSDAEMQSIQTTPSTQQLADLGASHLWDFDQASTSDPVLDLVGDWHQTAIVGTTVVTGDDPPGWTFGLAGGGALGEAIGDGAIGGGTVAVRGPIGGGAALTLNIDDTVGLADALARDVTRVTADSVTPADALARDVARLTADTVALADARALEAGKAPADTLGLADAITGANLGRAINVDDTVALADALARDVTRPVDDTVAVADARALEAGKALTDTAGVADTQARDVTHPIDDTAAVTDQITGANLGRAINVDDTVALADGLTTAGGKGANIDDTVGLADALARDVARAAADTVGVADAASSSTAKAVDDSVGLADARALEPARAVADTVGLADSLGAETGKGVTIADSVTVADATVRDLARNLNIDDTLALGDTIALAWGYARTIADSVDPADTLARNLTTALADAVAIVDAVVVRGADRLRARIPGHRAGAAGTSSSTAGRRIGGPGSSSGSPGRRAGGPGDVELYP